MDLHRTLADTAKSLSGCETVQLALAGTGQGVPTTRSAISRSRS